MTQPWQTSHLFHPMNPMASPLKMATSTWNHGFGKGKHPQDSLKYQVCELKHGNKGNNMK
jgi:hypothetical protein